MSTAAAVDGGGGNDVFATAINNDDRMVADCPSLPPPPPPMLPPPHPCPCLRRHHCCSICQRHCPSDAPVDGWLLCCLSPLACCVVRRPNLSAPPIVRCVVEAFSAGPPSRFAVHHHRLFVALLPSIQQHTNHITKLKTFPVSTSWTYFDLLRVSTCFGVIYSHPKSNIYLVKSNPLCKCIVHSFSLY